MTTTAAPTERFDVVIVGARCAGAATAMLLARAGVRVLVVERGMRGTDTLSTHALMRAGVLQLHRWGLLDELRAAGTPPVHRTTFRYGQNTTSVTLKPVAGVDALYAPRRTVLDPMLVDAAERAGAQFRFGTSFTDVTRDRRGCVDGIRGTDAHGRPMTVRARFTIGADGLASRVARRVDAQVERVASASGAYAYAHVPGVETTGYEWFYGPGVTAGVIPTNDEAACVFVGTERSRFRTELAPDVPAGFARLLRAASPDAAARVAAAAPVTTYRTFPGANGFFRAPWGPGWALVGDAGYFKDPISTHGISDALRDAELLARAVVTSLANGAVDEAMRGYHRTRNDLSHRLFATTEAIASHRWTLEHVERLVRSLSAAMTDEVTYLAGLDVVAGQG
jgi:flavin-dependent dehydrogenase